MRRFLSISLAVLLLVLCLSPAVNAATEDEVRTAKKIISVVYDDSGSMVGDTWAYANYATQALTALLNEQDDLYITYMSDPGKARPVDLKDIPKAVSDIRNWSHTGNTPGTALDTAKNVLENLSVSDPSVQFWLVIMTDGQIEMDDSIQKKLNSFKGQQMKNGTKINVVYLAMGPGAAAAKADASNGLYTYTAADAAAITGAMGEIANLISGRFVFTDVSQKDDTTITFSSKLPLYSISVLSQDSTAKVTGADAQGQSLNINRNIPLKAFDITGYSDRTLVGNAAVIDLKDASGKAVPIQAGSYTVTFSEPVKLSDLVVQYEPAIGIKVKITRDGIEISDFSQLAKDDKVDIEIFPVIPGTDTVIPADALPKNTSWSIEYVVDDQVADSGNGTKLSGVTLKDGENVVRGTMHIPGFAATVYQISFTLETHIYVFGITVDQPDPLTYYRSHIKDGSKEGGSIVFRITDNGVPMDKAALKTARVSLDIADISCNNDAITGWANRFGKSLAQCRLTQNDDGSYTLEPRHPLPFTAFLMMAGEYTVTVCVDKEPTVTAVGTFSLQPHEDDWKDLPGLIISFLLLLYLLYILFIKYKFRGQTVYYTVYRVIDGKGEEDGSQAGSKVFTFLSGKLLAPRRACRVKFHGLILRAGPDGSITVLGDSVAKCVYAYKQTSIPPRSMSSIVATMRKTERKTSEGIKREAQDMELVGASPIYFKTCADDRDIWCIYTKNK